MSRFDSIPDSIKGRKEYHKSDNINEYIDSEKVDGLGEMEGDVS